MNTQSKHSAYNESEQQTCQPASEHCATCSDEILPASVLSVDHTRELALVEIAQTTMEIDISLLGHVEPGDTLLVHGGVALSIW